jgi:hypothetical protein
MDQQRTVWQQQRRFKDARRPGGTTMRSYQVRLRETRMATDGTDDVALFDVAHEEDGQTWRVAVFLSPLFRWVRMGPGASVESRREMVAGMGARVITERLKRGLEPAEQEFVILATDYPGAPDPPDPLKPYDQVTVHENEAQAESPATD